MDIKEFIDLAKENKIEPIQITTFNTDNIEAHILNESLKNVDADKEKSYAIIGHYNNKDVKVTTNYLDKTTIDNIIMKANYLESNYKEVYIEESKELKDKKLSISFNIDEEIDKIIKAHSKKHSKVKNIETYYYVEQEEKTINNSYGLDISTISNTYSIYTNITTSDKNIISSTDDVLYSTKSNIDIDKFISKVIEESESKLIKETIDSKKYDVVLSPTFTSCLLDTFVEVLSKKLVRQKCSFLDGKLNKKIFGDNITIIEDPNNKDYPGYTKFDNEGVETYRKTIIDKGVLKTYLYNNKEALLENKKSTGNGYGDISARNIYINKGEKTEQELINSIKDGLYIRDYQSTGGTVINFINGDISLQITGQIIQDGKKTNSFETSILTTNIYELFSNVVEIGNNLEFKRKNAGAPSLYVKGMSISSN
ncbi:MAG: TldD/PmbA family protein [Bacilli bacterium]|nr:TldD/PmbA family protein [Bacilli bacterium]